VIKPQFLPDAEAEFLKEIAYYSDAREGLGIKFREAVMAAVAKAVANPGSGMPSASGTRSRLLKGFPFSVVYRASDKEFLIVSVAHHRRRPGYWLRRIK
jgi:toxin ParE1/3/4